jgi:hypothetical protein
MAKVYFKGLKGTDNTKTTRADETEETTLFENSKNIKLKFTRKQFENFQTACDIFTVVVSHPSFNDYVKTVLGNDVEVKSIRKQLVEPILQATEKIQNPEIKSMLPRKANARNTQSYFTEKIQITNACRMLYEKVQSDMEFELRYPVEEDIICITDIRKLLTTYFVSNDLKQAAGTVFTELLQTLAPNTFNSVKQTLVHPVGSSDMLIPKGHMKTVHAIVKELAFGG